MNLEQIKSRFQSGNLVQVDKAMLPEFDYLIDRIEKLSDGVVEQCDVNRNLRVKLEQLERENAELRKQLAAIPLTEFPQSFRDDLAEAIRLGRVQIK